RMMFDAAFRDRVYTNAETALQGLDLTPEECLWLITPDPRAYGTDTYRCSRALTGLLEEYPVAGALALRTPHGIDRLHGFFAADVFHHCIQERGSMAEAFGVYLGAEAFAKQPDIARMAEVEWGIARVRRAEDIPSLPLDELTPHTRLRLAPWVELLSLHPATLPRYSALFNCLEQYGASRLEAVLDTAYALPAGQPVQDDTTECVMIVGVSGATGPSLEPASDELGALLNAAQADTTYRELCTVAVRLGAEPHEALELIQGFLDERLLVQLAQDAQPLI
ncbi:MAG: hypothetical protein OEU26_07415, partial [Candidatus Tectomicrobia bacterium]|nr:hypothetical protein [Candidatus Tectomicrobia bacterium]